MKGLSMLPGLLFSADDLHKHQLANLMGRVGLSPRYVKENSKLTLAEFSYLLLDEPVIVESKDAKESKELPLQNYSSMRSSRMRK
jgi:hypothetical protein